MTTQAAAPCALPAAGSALSPRASGARATGPVRRILVIGCSGNGKSTFARRLAEKTGLPIVHLDQLYWRPNWVPAPKQEYLDAVAAATADESWVMDGNSPSTFHLRLPRAEHIVWFRFSRIRSLLRIVHRVLGSYGRVRADMAPGCPERFDLTFMRWVWNFERDYVPRILAGLSEHDAWARTEVVGTDAESAAALDRLVSRATGGIK